MLAFQIIYLISCTNFNIIVSNKIAYHVTVLVLGVQNTGHNIAGGLKLIHLILPQNTVNMM